MGYYVRLDESSVAIPADKLEDAYDNLLRVTMDWVDVV